MIITIQPSNQATNKASKQASNPHPAATQCAAPPQQQQQQQQQQEEILTHTQWRHDFTGSTCARVCGQQQ
jgi:hypothetical protein